MADIIIVICIAVLAGALMNIKDEDDTEEDQSCVICMIGPTILRMVVCKCTKCLFKIGE